MSDIHRQLNSFHSMIDKIGLDKEKDTLYLLGDYVDWGPDGVGVIQQIMKMQKDGFSIKCLMGNHEKMMLDVIDNLVLSGEEYQECVDIWYRNMGEDTHRLMMCLDNKERDNIIAWLRALNITYPIMITIFKTLWIDLINNFFFPPFLHYNHLYSNYNMNISIILHFFMFFI